MGELVNLRRARKRRVRTADADLAEVNRTLFGVAKRHRTQAAMEQAMADRRLSGHRMDAAVPPRDDD